MTGLTPSLAGGTFTAGATALQVNFSEDIVGGGTAANYALQSLGPDALLGTADDAVVSLSASYSGTTAALTFPGLAAGVYRLTVKDAITGKSGVPLDGDDDGLAGGSYVTDFVVLAGSGSLFQNTPQFDSGLASISSVASGDFNNDGRTDLVLATGGTGSLAIVLAGADGSFGTPTIVSTGSSGLFAVAVADFNGDGRLDIAAGHNSGVAILLGRGDGTFNLAASYGGFARSVAVGDYNGDGKPDLAVANSTNNTIGVLLNNGDGSFRSGTAVGIPGMWPKTVTSGDFNGDGRANLVMTDGSYSTTSVGLLLGRGDGTFNPMVRYETGGADLESVGVGDFNGDGRQRHCRGPRELRLGRCLEHGWGVARPRKRGLRHAGELRRGCHIRLVCVAWGFQRRRATRRGRGGLL